jgi:radical SAM superfamily enzyme YgiQ (UPF0313 family)
MKLLLVYPNINTGNGPHYPHGVGALAAACKSKGHDVAVWMVDHEVTSEKAAEVFRSHAPDWVGFSFSSHQWTYVTKLATVAKQCGLSTIAGGVHATHATKSVIAHKAIDYVIRGQGEGAICDLLDGRQPQTIANVSGKDFSNPLRPLIADPDSMPVYDRNDFDMNEILRVNGYELSLMARRGCPWPCTYCCNHANRALYKGQGAFLEPRSHEHLFAEIDLLCKNHQVDSLYFEDDIFTQDKQWAHTFCEQYSKRFALPFRVYLRPGQADYRLLKRLADVGLYKANIGIESGSERIRKEILRRNMTNPQIIELFNHCKTLDIETRVFNIIGFPGETESDIEQTIALNKKVLSDQVQVSIFHPYPGTELYDQCIEQGIYQGETRDSYFDETTVVDLVDLPAKRLSVLYEDFCKEAGKIEKTAFNQNLLRTLDDTDSLLVKLDRAKIEQQGAEPVQIKRVMIKGERNFALFAHPRSRIRFPVNSLSTHTFIAHLAMDPLCLEWGTTGVRFSLSLKQNGTEKLLAECSINPKNDATQIKWNRWEVQLPDCDKGELILSTDPDKGDDLTGAWALWGMPRLERRR